MIPVIITSGRTRQAKAQCCISVQCMQRKEQHLAHIRPLISLKLFTHDDTQLSNVTFYLTCYFADVPAL